MRKRVGATLEVAYFILLEILQSQWSKISGKKALILSLYSDKHLLLSAYEGRKP